MGPVVLYICTHDHRAGFSLSGALFRKIMWGPPSASLNPHFLSSQKMTTFLVIIIVLQFCNVTAHFLSSKKLTTLFCSSLSILLISPPDWIHTTRTLTVLSASRLSKICRSSCGAPPLFGRTCWTCLNPPLLLTVPFTLNALSGHSGLAGLRLCTVSKYKLYQIRCIHRVQEKSKPKCFCGILLQNSSDSDKSWYLLYRINLLQRKLQTFYLTWILSYSLHYLVKLKKVVFFWKFFCWKTATVS